MTKIRKLSTETVSKIAAGEVVERPMNIVKELVENSLDADADQISITIAGGGKDRIEVRDNGTGIIPDELKLAFELHTTSKLDNDDPSNVATLGFRGEALASIAAVSHIEVTSKHHDEDLGRKLVMEGGKIIEDQSVRSQIGTSITVKGIFFNTPARRKFLKTSSTERKRITDLITNYCLMYPDVHFKLIEKMQSGNKVRIESPSRKSMMAVIFDVLGHEIANDLVAFQQQIGDWHIDGYISKPSLTRSDRAFQFINVNGRPIHHKDLQKTIEDAYGSQLMRRTHPVIILKIEGPIEAIDFNIHPQKSEIRFKENEILFDQLPEAILSTLSEEVELPPLQKNKLDRIRTKQKKSRTKSKRNNSTKVKGSTQSNQKQPRNEAISVSNDSRIDHQSDTEDITIPYQRSTTQTSLFNERIIEEGQNITVLGHIMNKFGLVYFKNELWLVDVHAADERIKFEQYAHGKERISSSQQLLQPLPIELTPSEKQILVDHQDDLRKFGLKLSNGGDKTVLIHAVPVYYDQDITPDSIRDLLYDIISFLNDDDAETGPIQSPLDNMEYAIVSRLACHSAIRSGYPVANTRIKQVITELLECEFPWTCAHGRPTVLRLPKSRLESFFKR